MKIENTEVFGFRAALRGMRNPYDSWNKGDTEYGVEPLEPHAFASEHPIIGPNDMELALKLIKRGSPHEKFLRQIIVWADLTLPVFVWSEFDTYKVATVRNSCSTMNMLGKRDLEQSDFEYAVSPNTMVALNRLCTAYRRPGSKMKGDARAQLKSALPSGYLQKATVSFSYATAVAMYHQRRNHRLSQWRATCAGSICEWLLCLPYMREFCGEA